MKRKFIKIAKELGYTIELYETYRYMGCQCYDMVCDNQKGFSVTVRVANGLGDKDKDYALLTFKEELESVEVC